WYDLTQDRLINRIRRSNERVRTRRLRRRILAVSALVPVLVLALVFTSVRGGSNGADQSAGGINPRVQVGKSSLRSRLLARSADPVIASALAAAGPTAHVLATTRAGGFGPGVERAASSANGRLMVVSQGVVADGWVPGVPRLRLGLVGRWIYAVSPDGRTVAAAQGPMYHEYDLTTSNLLDPARSDRFFTDITALAFARSGR